MSKAPKYTKLPPAPQEVFFQEYQFDPDIGEGTDPILFTQGSGESAFRRPLKKGRGFKNKDEQYPDAQTQEAKQMKKAKESLKGHENEEEILKILKAK